MKAEWSNKDSLEMPTTTTSDYIKREDAINKLADEYVFDARSEYEGTFTRAYFIDDAKETLADIPNADVVEVVRCKDCIHNGSIDTDCPFGWKDKKFNMPKPNDYCSYGERKEQEHEQTESQIKEEAKA